jgi:hypothetical protein
VVLAKTLGSKLQRRYDALPHVVGKSFAIELADFHAPGPMVWSREALFGYLCGMRPEVVEGDCVVRQSEPMVRIHRAPPGPPANRGFRSPKTLKFLKSVLASV